MITKSSIFKSSVFTSCAMAGICMLSISSAQAVVVDGKNWRQLTETVDITYEQMDAIYDIATGTLDTSTTTIGSTDFDGWTWASAAEVEELFVNLTGLSFVSGLNYQEVELTEAEVSSIFSVFDPTYLSASNQLFGKTRTINPDNSLSVGYGASDTPATSSLPDIMLRSNYPLDHQYYTVGMFLYKDVASVPVPAAVWLFCTGFLGLIGAARRKSLCVYATNMIIVFGVKGK